MDTTTLSHNLTVLTREFVIGQHDLGIFGIPVQPGCEDAQGCAASVD